MASDVKTILSYSLGCFFRVLENSNTICIFCESAAVDLENTTVCTYSKIMAVFIYIFKMSVPLISSFFGAIQTTQWRRKITQL